MPEKMTDPLPLQSLNYRVSVPNITPVELDHVELEAAIDAAIVFVDLYLLKTLVSLGVKAMQVLLAVRPATFDAEKRRAMMLQALNLFARKRQINFSHGGELQLTRSVRNHTSLR